MWVYLQEDDC